MLFAWLDLIAVSDLHRVLLELRSLCTICSSSFSSFSFTATETLAFRRVGSDSTNIGIVIFLWNMLIFFGHINIVLVQVDTTRSAPRGISTSVDSADPPIFFDSPSDLISFLPGLWPSHLRKTGLVLLIILIHASICTNLVMGARAHSR